MSRFYCYFASAYGTFWFVACAFAFVTQSNVQLGALGYIGFPVIAFIYALIRITASENQSETIFKLKVRVKALSKKLRDSEEQRRWLEHLLPTEEEDSTSSTESSTDIKPA